MPRELRTTRPLPGSGADKTPWPAVQIPRRCSTRAQAAHSFRRPFVQSSAAAFQARRMNVAVDSRV